MSNLPEPHHLVTIGGVERRLRYRFVDWMNAERATGVGIRSGWGVPITTPAQMLPMMLLAGLNHEIHGLTLEGAAGLIDYEAEDELMAACAKAIYDYEPVAKKKLLALAEATKDHPEFSMVSMLIELIQSTTGTDSGPSVESDSASTPTKSTTSRRGNSTRS